MRALAFIALLALAAALTDPTEKLDGVLDLDPDTFDKFVNGGRDALVEFYAPWCGHCKHLTPVYKELGAAVAADPALKARVVIAKVDADQHRSLGERFGVRGFPTIKHFRRGKPVAAAEDYTGARTADAFLAHIKATLKADGGFARVADLDGLAASFAADPSAAALKKLQAAAAKVSGDASAHAATYAKVAAKGLEKGADWFGKEAARVDRLLASGSVGGGRVAELAAKLSVLGAFVEEEGKAADA